MSQVLPVIGVLVGAGVVLALVWTVLRPAEKSDHADFRPGGSSSSDARPTATHWNPHIPKRRQRAAGDTGYHVKSGDMESGMPGWNPFSAEQSMQQRVRTARQEAANRPSGTDYYALLGLQRGASDQEITEAYRRHAAALHPDRFFRDPERRALAEAKLKELNAAMQVLRDPLRRATYDGRGIRKRGE